MSIKIMSAVWELDLPDSEKLALLALADCANDEGYCWPSMRTLAKKCSKSDRTVQKAIQSLSEKGHLSRNERPGKGIFYHIHPRSDVTPETASPPKRLRQTPEAASDKPSRTINTPLTPHSANDEGSDIGDRFWQAPTGKSWSDTGPMLRKLHRKSERQSIRKARPMPAPVSARPPRPSPAVHAKVRETVQSEIMHGALRQKLGGTVYAEWFEHAAMIYDEPGATVIVGSAFQQSQIEDRFSSALLAAARNAFGDGVSWIRVQAEQ